MTHIFSFHIFYIHHLLFTIALILPLRPLFILASSIFTCTYQSPFVTILLCFRSLPSSGPPGLCGQPDVAAHTRAHGAGPPRQGHFSPPAPLACVSVTTRRDSASCFSLQLLLFPLSDCARYQQLMDETEQTAEFINITKKYQVAFSATTVVLFKSFRWARILLMKLEGDEFALCFSSLRSGPHGAGGQQDRVEQHERELHLERVRHAILRGERRRLFFFLLSCCSFQTPRHYS